MKRLVVCGLLWATATPIFAHRLDEYLQVALISIWKNRLRAKMYLTPGVAVYKQVIATIDGNADGTLSGSEQRRYAEKVRHDVSLSVDGAVLSLQLTSFKFPKVEEMKKGLGYIEINLDAAFPTARGSHRIVFENHHQSKFAAYQVNCLMPDDPSIHVTGQIRNSNQSRYELSYQ